MDGFLEWVLSGTDPSVDWNYAIVTLLMRFIAVFIVLLVIQAALQLAAFFIRRHEARRRAAVVPVSTAAMPGLRSGPAPDERTMAAIALALELDSRRPQLPASEARPQSPWAIAGRIRQLNAGR